MREEEKRTTTAVASLVTRRIRQFIRFRVKYTQDKIHTRSKKNK